MAREGLRNVVCHSRATFAEISLDAEGEDVVVTVSDDGVGLARDVEVSGSRMYATTNAMGNGTLVSVRL